MMTRRAARLLDLAREIARIEAVLAIRRAEFTRLVDARVVEEVPVSAQETHVTRVTLLTRVEACFDSGAVLSALTVAKEVGCAEDTVRAYFSKLKKAGRIEHIGVGQYRKPLTPLTD